LAPKIPRSTYSGIFGDLDSENPAVSIRISRVFRTTWLRKFRSPNNTVGFSDNLAPKIPQYTDTQWDFRTTWLRKSRGPNTVGFAPRCLWLWRWGWQWRAKKNMLSHLVYIP
jgi:hypothetical protein